MTGIYETLATEPPNTTFEAVVDEVTLPENISTMAIETTSPETEAAPVTQPEVTTVTFAEKTDVEIESEDITETVPVTETTAG